MACETLRMDEGWAPTDQQVLGGGFLATCFVTALFPAPDLAPLLQRLLPGAGTEVGGARLVLGLFGLSQRELRLFQSFLRRHGEFGQMVDMTLALSQRSRPCHARWRRREQLRSTLPIRWRLCAICLN